jgi:tetratricopeptide (TPR) repeat protein
MASIIEGYKYDIFISYRQKDNKYDGWIAEFVDNLKKELESTFKEEITVYFDINPHDGLLETHDVDESLKEKLKCVIFIPIFSRTYCDPKSFAWVHEFKTFVEMASTDHYGLKVKLPNGNVASRVLPICIHNLDIEDIRLCESITGGVLRSIDFIYKEPGVNRSLKPDDDEKLNLNKTKYRNQINKVALAIKEIFQGIKSVPTQEDNENQIRRKSAFEITKEYSDELVNKPAKNKKKSWLTLIFLTVLLTISGIFIIPAILSNARSGNSGEQSAKLSIMISAFENKTEVASLDSWKETIPDLLKESIASSKEFSVRNTGADWNLTGSIKKIIDKELIVINLTNIKSDEIILTKSSYGKLDSEYRGMVDSLSWQIKNFLEIKALERDADPEFNKAFTNSADAYRKYIEGMKFILNADYSVAVKSFEQAYTIDTNFNIAAFFCSFAYCFNSQNKSAQWERIAYRGKERLTEDYRMWLEFWHGWFNTKNKDDILNYCSAIEKSDTRSRFILFDVGCAYSNVGKSDKAVDMMEKVEKVNADLGEDWKYRDFYRYYSDVCHNAGRYDKENTVLNTGLKLFPDDIDLIWKQARLALLTGRVKRADELIKRFEYLCKRLNLSEGDVQASLGNLFVQVDSLDKAEKCFRQALDLQPENVIRLNDIAYFLINKDRNIDEGIKLIDKALEFSPENYVLWSTKGWGLYKQCKYKESSELLEKSWNMSPSYGLQDTFLHLEAAKKALSGQK